MSKDNVIFAGVAIVLALVVAGGARLLDNLPGGDNTASTPNTTPTVENPTDPTPNDPNEPNVDLRTADADAIASTVENVPDISGFRKGLKKLRERLKQMPRTDAKEEIQILRNKDDLQEVENRLSFIGIDPSSVSRETKLSFVPVPNRPVAPDQEVEHDVERKALRKARQADGFQQYLSRVRQASDFEERLDITYDFTGPIDTPSNNLPAMELLEQLRREGLI